MLVVGLGRNRGGVLSTNKLFRRGLLLDSVGPSHSALEPLSLKTDSSVSVRRSVGSDEPPSCSAPSVLAVLSRVIVSVQKDSETLDPSLGTK